MRGDRWRCCASAAASSRCDRCQLRRGLACAREGGTAPSARRTAGRSSARHGRRQRAGHRDAAAALSSDMKRSSSSSRLSQGSGTATSRVNRVTVRRSAAARPSRSATVPRHAAQAPAAAASACVRVDDAHAQPLGQRGVAGCELGQRRRSSTRIRPSSRCGPGRLPLRFQRALPGDGGVEQPARAAAPRPRCAARVLVPAAAAPATGCASASVLARAQCARRRARGRDCVQGWFGCGRPCSARS
jgi:hypothetical protein